MPLSINAKEINYIATDFNKSAVENIDQFFLQNPKENNVIWTPKIKGKSRYAFSIQKDAYLISKIHSDASDLYYLSEKIDSGLKFKPDKSKNIDIFISENNSNLYLSQNILSKINAVLFLKNKEKISFGVNLNKDFIISKNTFGNFGFEQAKNEYTIFDAKSIRLSNDENSEFYVNMNHEFKSDYLNVAIGNTWFDIANQFDLTLGIKEQGKKVESELYVTFGDEDIKFEVGFDQIKNSSNMNLFFSLKLEKTLNDRNFGSNIIITSQKSTFNLKKLSLKSLRKKNLDNIWKKSMNYN